MKKTKFFQAFMAGFITNMMILSVRTGAPWWAFVLAALVAISFAVHALESAHRNNERV